ncbi:hypothetical protein IC611_00100 [Proteus mirabilis]
MTQQDTAIIPQFSAFVDKGIVRGSAALEQNNNQRLFSLIVNGLNVPSLCLIIWVGNYRNLPMKQDNLP